MISGPLFADFNYLIMCSFSMNKLLFYL